MPDTAVTDIAVIQLQRLQNFGWHGRCGVSRTQITQMFNLALSASGILFFSEVMCNLRIVFSLKRAVCMFPVPRDQHVTSDPSGSSCSTGRKRSSLCRALSVLWQVLMALRRLLCPLHPNPFPWAQGLRSNPGLCSHCSWLRRPGLRQAGLHLTPIIPASPHPDLWIAIPACPCTCLVSIHGPASGCPFCPWGSGSCHPWLHGHRSHRCCGGTSNTPLKP